MPIDTQVLYKEDKADLYNSDYPQVLFLFAE